MSDTNQSAEPAAEPQADEGTPEEIAEARSLGWKPASEWRGKVPERGLMGARDYLDHAHNIKPMIEKQLAKERKEKDALYDEFTKFKNTHTETVANLERMTKAALAEQRRKIEREYADKKEAAVEVGDTTKYRQLVKDEKEDLAELKKNAEPAAEEKKAAPQAQTLPREVEEAISEWKIDNDWFEKNRAMTLAASDEEARLAKEYPGLSLKKRLEKVSEYIREEFPHKFKSKGDDDDDGGDDSEPRRRGSAVEGGSRLNGSGGSRSLYSKLPAEAKAQCNKFIEEGLFLEKGENHKNPQHLHAARERYARDYENQ